MFDELTLKDAALQYANLGWSVFPLRCKGKEPATPHGFLDATTDKNQIEKWWSHNPNYNVAVATGNMSGGLVVIDLDEDKDKHGYEVLTKWQKEHGLVLPDTAISITGRGGYHYVYREPNTSYTSSANIYDGVDVRANGGYVIVPPSVHPNGKKYEWEYEPGADIEIAPINDVVRELLKGDEKHQKKSENKSYEVPVEIRDGNRTDELVKLIGSLRGKGLSGAAIRAAVTMENETRCNPPLSDKELEKQVFPALKRDWSVEKPYHKDGEGYALDWDGNPIESGENAQESQPPKIEISPMGDVKEEVAEWLIPEYVPKSEITCLVGEGGCGKTTIWCALAAAISSGKPSFLEHDIPFTDREPKKVLFFTSEDSATKVLRRRLRINGANLNNIFFLDVKNPQFTKVNFGSRELEMIIRENRPDLCIFDPVQSFLSERVKMAERNQMRKAITHLARYGELYGTTIILIVHCNKMSGVYGRRRMADSSDLWDISRSVLLVGETKEPGVRYISQEKNSYAPKAATVMFDLDDQIIHFRGTTDKKDRDFILEEQVESKTLTKQEEAEEVITDYLKNDCNCEEIEMAQLDGFCKSMNISASTLGRAKANLKKMGVIKTRNTGYGKEKKYFVQYIWKNNEEE